MFDESLTLADQGGEERLRAAGLRQARGRQPQGAHGPQSADRRADQDPGQARVQVPARQEPEGHGAWQEVGPGAPGPSAAPTRRLALHRRGPAARSLARFGDAAARLAGRRLPAPAGRRRGRAPLFDFAALPWPPSAASRSPGAPSRPGDGERRRALWRAALPRRVRAALADAARPRRDATSRIRSRSRRQLVAARSITRQRSASRRSSRARRASIASGSASASFPFPRARCPARSAGRSGRRPLRVARRQRALDVPRARSERRVRDDAPSAATRAGRREDRRARRRHRRRQAPSRPRRLRRPRRPHGHRQHRRRHRDLGPARLARPRHASCTPWPACWTSSAAGAAPTRRSTAWRPWPRSGPHVVQPRRSRSRHARVPHRRAPRGACPIDGHGRHGAAARRGARVLPMRTTPCARASHVGARAGAWLAFQEYFVRERARVDVLEVDVRRRGAARVRRPA